MVWNGRSACSSSTPSANGTETVARAIGPRPRSPSPAAATRSRRSRSTASQSDIGYISTGGGAFLEVLEGKTLPAFEILQRRAAG